MAQADLRHETRYSARMWGEQHAREYMRALKARIRGLALHHSLYAEHPELGAGICLMTFKGNRVVFTVDHDRRRVVIVAVQSVYQNAHPASIRQRLEPDA